VRIAPRTAQSVVVKVATLCDHTASNVVGVVEDWKKLSWSYRGAIRAFSSRD
jgi:hypothetical protein